jgi:hypothetical protein
MSESTPSEEFTTWEYVMNVIPIATLIALGILSFCLALAAAAGIFN